MLHFIGWPTEFEIADAARKYIPIYQKPGQDTVYIPFCDDLKQKSGT